MKLPAASSGVSKYQPHMANFAASCGELTPKEIRKEYYTVDNSLELPVDQIFKGFTSTVKNEIRRSERENVLIGSIESIEEFSIFHNNFATAKGISKADKQLLIGYQKNLIITCATFENKILSAHAYIVDKQAGLVRLLFSSNSRLTEDVN